MISWASSIVQEKVSTAEIRSMPLQTRKYQSECHARVRLRGLRGQDWGRAGKAPVTLLGIDLLWTEARNAEERSSYCLDGHKISSCVTCAPNLTFLASPCLFVSIKSTRG